MDLRNGKQMAMRISRRLLFALAAMLLSVVCHAQPKCPWLNEATARGILGGSVTVTVHIDNRGGGACEFSSQQGAAVHQLRISVDLMTDIPKQFPSYLAQCPPTSAPLRSVGNEAVMCSIAGQGEQYIERVVSRVRNQAFVVNVSSKARDDPSMTQEMRHDQANLVAEQIAGILF
jgi:hypothetical protein